VISPQKVMTTIDIKIPTISLVTSDIKIANNELDPTTITNIVHNNKLPRLLNGSIFFA
jgi:hypothetical protein